MKAAGQYKSTTDLSAKDKTNKGADKTACCTSSKSKTPKELSCRKSEISAGKTSKQRQKTTVNNNERFRVSHLPSSTPSLPPKTHLATSSSQHTHPEVLIPVRLQSILQIQKFQLQLFPIDEATRKCLEEENCCPYLELTLTTRKKISSVIKHLKMKWGNSISDSKELMLFPYNVQVESLASHSRWTLKDSDITAADVHVAIGEPAVFRLRYGWFNSLEPKISTLSPESHHLADQIASEVKRKKNVDDHEEQQSSVIRQKCGLPAGLSLIESVDATASNESIKPAFWKKDNLRSDSDANLLWVDGISNMSFGALFSEVEATEGAKCCRQMPTQKNFNLEQISVSCDSFDTAIAAHIARYQPRNQSSPLAHPSILDAEETCNPFSFQKLTSSNKNIEVQSRDSPITSSSQNAERDTLKPCSMLSSLVEPSQDDNFVPLNMSMTSEGDPPPIRDDNAQPIFNLLSSKDAAKEEILVDLNAPNDVNNQFDGLDMHWPPSLGPLQFVASTSLQSISSDSNGLSGFVSTSMDIF